MLSLARERNFKYRYRPALYGTEQILMFNVYISMLKYSYRRAKMEDNAKKLADLLDSLPQSVNKLATVEEISIVLCAVTPASLSAVVPNLSFNTVFECFAFCNRYGLLLLSLYYIYRVGQKTKPHTFIHIFAKYWPIFKIFLSSHSVENL